MPITQFLDITDSLEKYLSFSSGKILPSASRKLAERFMYSNPHLHINCAQFEALLKEFSGKNISEIESNNTNLISNCNSLADETCVPSISKDSSSKSNLVNKSYNNAESNDEIDLNGATHPPKYISFTEDTVEIKPMQSQLNRCLRLDKDRRSISLGIYPSSNTSWFEIDDLSHKDFKSTQEQKHSIFQVQNHRSELQSQLSIYESQLKELQENDSRRLQNLEEIEHELETTQNELHERRMRQNEELQRAKEAAAALEDEISKSYSYDNEDEKNDMTVDEIHILGNEDLISPAEIAPHLFTPEEDLNEDLGDVKIRLHRLEEEKRSYQDVLDYMQKERISYFNVIEQLKKQLADLQFEIDSKKALSSSEQLIHQDPVIMIPDHATEQDNNPFNRSVFTTSSQNQYITGNQYHHHRINEFDEIDHKQSSDSLKPSSLLSPRRVVFILGAVSLCFLGALAHEVVTGSGTADFFKWGKYGKELHSWGASIEN